MIPRSVCWLCGGPSDSGHICPQPPPVWWGCGACSSKNAEIAALKDRLWEKHTGWKRCETHDSWTLLPDAQCPACEIAALKASLESAESERIEWVQRGERAEERCKELEAKVERLVEAGERLRCWCGGSMDACGTTCAWHAWTAAKEGE